MKISLALGPRQALSRQTAWGCLTTNLAMPGFGSLVAGHRSGYFQAALAILGLILTTVFGIRSMVWAVANWSSIQANDVDPFDTLLRMWLVMRWAFAGIAVFAIGWIWALGTSLLILRAAGTLEPNTVPPRLQ
jgi:hypothetical protein